MIWLALIWLALSLGVLARLAHQLWRECRPDLETLTREERDQLAAIAWEALMAHTKALPGVTGKPTHPHIEWREPERFVRIVQHRN